MVDDVRHALAALALVAFLPAVVTHEAAHALVGRLSGARVDVERALPTPVLRCEWKETPPLVAVVATQAAPLVVGVALLPAVLELYGPAILPVRVYLVASWVLVTHLSRTDIFHILRAVADASQR
jgi:hypothetical protein